MARRSSGSMAAISILGVLGLTSSAQAQESEIPLDKVPKAVMAAARAKFPGAKIHEAAKETEAGKTVFELSLTQQNRKIDATFQENGTLELAETVVAENE